MRLVGVDLAKCLTDSNGLDLNTVLDMGVARILRVFVS